MEKIYFDESTFIWKKKLNYIRYNEELLFEAHDLIINNVNNTQNDGYIYNYEFNDVDFMGEILLKNRLDEILQVGIDECKKIYNEQYNKVNYDAWISLVRSKNPIQSDFKGEELKYHIHTELNKNLNIYVPDLTFIYYIQMPDMLEYDDGALFFKNKENIEYSIMPEEDELIIFNADIPHTPKKAPKANKDRIVFACNVGFENIKKEKSLL